MMHRVPRRLLSALLVAATCLAPAHGAPPRQPGLLHADFLYEKAPFRQCHASTIAVSHGNLVAAWFGGTREGHADVGIWLARHDGKAWSAPVEIANGVQDGGKRFPCWNPVLFQPKKGPLLLFYKVGPNPRAWWGMVLASEDGGRAWSKPRRLPDGLVGSTKNLPVQLPDGSLLHPSSTEDQGWRVHFEHSNTAATEWQRFGPVKDDKALGAIQPTVLIHPGGRLQALCRTRQKKIAETWSSDGGKTWSPLTATALPNPNSGITALTLADGRHLLVYNHTERGRTPLNLAMSRDGKTWQAALVLEDQPGEYSYPFVVQAPDGRVHIVYTWRRTRIRHVVIDPAQLVLHDLP
jgi:predicted neuraminidase